MDATVQKWGNSLALRIPNSLVKDAGLRQGSVVELEMTAGNIVMKPKKERKLSLARMLKQVTPENLHSEEDWGRAVGKETW